MRQAVALFLQFVPLEGEIHDFFRPISSQILSLLRRTSCLPSEVSPDSALTVAAFKQPSQLLFVRNPFIRQHIPQTSLESSLQLSYLDSVVLTSVNNALQQQLGLSGITIEHLISIAQDTLREYSSRPKFKYTTSDSASFYQLDSDEDSDSSDEETLTARDLSPCEGLVPWITSWLACVHIVMEDATMTPSTIAKLKQLKIIPLSDGTLASIEGGSLFFPTDSERGTCILEQC